MKKAGRIALAILAASVMILLGFLFSMAGYSMMRQWHWIRLALAGCGVIWMLAGPVMFVAGWWVLGSLGRKKTPLLAGGAASIVAGAVLVAGVLSHVIPCSGPS